MTNNDRSLQQLAWAIQASVGQFKLILAKCNYVQQRDRLIAELQKISAVQISVLALKPSQRTLYTAIREEFGHNVQALTIVGLDKLHDLPQMLIAANQVREEFRKSFPFPIVMWINDEIHQQLMQIAPDLESWTTTKNFAIAVDDLTQFLQNTAAQLFANVLNINLQNITEIQSAWQELQNQGQDLAPELKANCDFVLGLVEYIHKNLDGAIEYYHQSLVYWRTVNNYEYQGKILAQIAICYYEKARADERNRPINRPQARSLGLTEQSLPSQAGDIEADDGENRPQARSLGLTEQSLPSQAGNLEAAKAAFVDVAAPFRVSAVNRETITNYLQQAITAFQTAQRPNLIANSLEQFGIILSYLEDWQQLKTLAQQALTVHEAENNSLRISQDYGFLAETELAQNNWQQAQEFAQTALKLVATTHQPVPPELSQLNIIAHRQKLLLIIAEAQENLAQQPAAINYLERARELSIADNDPQIYLIILDKLKSLYFQQKQYLKAFDAKLEARSIEQQFGLRAFIGAGRLQATKQLDTQVLTAVPGDNQGNIAPEIAASGRQLDVERLIERIGRSDYKLIVIHGQSGVGKSSLVNAGLVPALKQKAIGVQDNLVVAIRVYTNWAEELGRVLLGERQGAGGERQGAGGREQGELRSDNSAFLLDNSSSEGDNSSFLLDSSSSEGDNSSFLLDSSSSEGDNSRFLLDNSSSEGDNSSFLLDSSSSEGDNSRFLLDNSSSEHDNSSSEGENSTFSPDNLTSEPKNPTSQPPLVPLPPAPCPLPPAPCPSPLALLTQLRENEQRNLRTVLIFDQFEEFFFVYPEPKQRRQFFEFLGECLNILSVKVILSLRIDYLHYLLECNRLESLKIIGNDILSNNVLYELGNFSPSDTKAIIQRLTQNTSFYLEPGLIDKLVQELAGELGEVRPIELQVVGAQLQTENITTLAKYRELGGNAKEELVKRYLAEVVNDCGVENQQAAELLLYLLTDEKGTRPLKTRAEIERDLQVLVVDVTTDRHKLNLILEIFVKSGLVVLLPEKPADRYQLVHDYLAAFIRQQQEPKLKQVMAELEEERKQRKISEAKLNKLLKRALMGSVAAGLVLAGLAVTAWDAARRADEQKKQADVSEINAITNSSEALFLSELNFDSLIEGLKAAEKLKNAELAPPNTRMQTIATLRQAVYLQPDENKFRERNTLEGHSGFVRGVSFSPDGKTIATASSDSTVKLWNISGKPLKTLKGHSGAVRGVSFSPDGKTIASASDDSTVKLWDISGKLLKTLKGHSGYVYSVSFSPDGKTIASASDDSTVKLWDISGKLLKTLKGHSGSVWGVSFSADGKTIASGSVDSTVKLWDISGKPLTTLKGHSGYVRGVSFSPGGKTIATASSDSTVKLWDISGKPLTTLPSERYANKGHSGYVRGVSFSPGGKTIASGSDDRTVKLWDISGKPLTTLPSERYANTGYSGYVRGVSFSPDGKTIASASVDSTVKLWDISGKPLTTLKGHSGAVRGVSFSPDGKTIASASVDSTVKLWDISGKLLKTLKGHSGYVLSVSFSPDGKTIATASSDSTVKLWDISGKPLTTLKGHSGYVLSVSFSPDGKTIATASSDSTVKLWDISGKPLTTLKGHSGYVLSVSFSADGKTIASASVDSTVKLWDISGKLLKTLKGHSGYVLSVSFSPDGKTIASASSDSTVKLWDISGKLLKTLKGHSGYVLSVSFSPDGKTIASASEDGTVILWDLDLDNLLASGCNWLNNYLATHPDVLEDLKACQTSAITKAAAPALVTQGEELARNQDINLAVAKFRQALEWNPSLKFDPQAKAKQLADASALVEKGESLVQAGNFDGAVANFQQALQLDPSLDFKPKVKAATLLVEQGTSLVWQDKFKEALAAYTNAQKLDPKVKIAADDWYTLCWQGSLQKQAADVMFACNQAVKLAPKNGNIRDSRGLARALTSDYQGAIADFEAYIAWTDNKDNKAQRQSWVKDLKAGKNPFTDDVLKKL
ncbi:nSTAND1 domain-containing NTPase [Calothrix anomala]|uniref:Ribosome assembly protein 4 n=1 Tax=Calothrix anomala FACHB-343 TaxID=2692894 RepID=A0ABR8AZ43_9CYAN|nr:ribosome assembly protein 4 [Calothrix anomala]MBD2227407.1 ribosome assembly protein 4 [Calothrix anomala FACHB-343]